MLKYSPHQQICQTLAIHYARKIDHSFFLDFVLSRADIGSAEDAATITLAFWEITDLAVEDYQNDIAVEGIVDLESWMFKLFNLVRGYVVKSGYAEVWDEATERYHCE